MPIRVAIVEDNTEIREGLCTLINGFSGYRCVATYPDAEKALRGLPTQDVDVVLMDINLPGMSGIECVEELKEKCPDMQFMMLTVYEDDDRIFKSLMAGATGYILKKTPPSELLDAIRDLHNGGPPGAGGVARRG